MGENAAKLCKIASDLLCFAQGLPDGIIRSAVVEAAITLSDAVSPLSLEKDICSRSLPSQQNLDSTDHPYWTRALPPTASEVGENCSPSLGGDFNLRDLPLPIFFPTLPLALSSLPRDPAS